MRHTGIKSKAPFSPCRFQNWSTEPYEERHHHQLYWTLGASQTKGSISRNDNPISTYFGFNSDEPTQISKLRFSEVILCLLRISGWGGTYIHNKFKNHSIILSQLGGLYLLRIGIWLSYYKDSQVAKSFWIAHYSALRCWRARGKAWEFDQKILRLSVGKNSMLTQLLELTAVWVSAHRKGNIQPLFGNRFTLKNYPS